MISNQLERNTEIMTADAELNEAQSQGRLVRPCVSAPVLLRFFIRNFGAFLPGFRQSDSNRLFAALHRAAFPSTTGLERPLFLAVHGALHAFPRSLSVFSAAGFLSCALLLRCHLVVLLSLRHRIAESGWQQSRGL
jgi:hypothetical protein